MPLRPCDDIALPQRTRGSRDRDGETRSCWVVGAPCLDICQESMDNTDPAKSGDHTQLSGSIKGELRCSRALDRAHWHLQPSLYLAFVFFSYVNLNLLTLVDCFGPEPNIGPVSHSFIRQMYETWLSTYTYKIKEFRRGDESSVYYYDL